MNLAQKLQEISKHHREVEDDVVYCTLQVKVIKEMTEAAGRGKDGMLIKLTNEGELYWKTKLLTYLKDEKITAIEYNCTETECHIKVDWNKPATAALT